MRPTGRIRPSTRFFTASKEIVKLSIVFPKKNMKFTKVLFRCLQIRRVYLSPSIYNEKPLIVEWSNLVRNGPNQTPFGSGT